MTMVEEYEPTAKFELDVDEVEVLLAFHMLRDGDDQDIATIDHLWQAALALGGDPMEVERLVEADREAADECFNDETDDAALLADLIEALKDTCEAQGKATDYLLEVSERDFEDQYPKIWARIFDNDAEIFRLKARIDNIEIDRSRKAK